MQSSGREAYFTIGKYSLTKIGWQFTDSGFVAIRDSAKGSSEIELTPIGFGVGLLGVGIGNWKSKKQPVGLNRRNFGACAQAWLTTPAINQRGR